MQVSLRCILHRARSKSTLEIVNYELTNLLTPGPEFKLRLPECIELKAPALVHISKSICFIENYYVFINYSML